MMNKIVNHPMWNTNALLFARVLMGGFFLLAGITKVSGIEGTAEMIAGAGLPMPVILAYLAAILEIAAGAAIILGKYFKEAALSLALFTFVISFIFHGPNSWAENMMQQLMFMKNMAIVAGLLFMAAHGAGKTWSLNI